MAATNNNINNNNGSNLHLSVSDDHHHDDDDYQHHHHRHGLLSMFHHRSHHHTSSSSSSPVTPSITSSTNNATTTTTSPSSSAATTSAFIAYAHEKERKQLKKLKRAMFDILKEDHPAANPDTVAANYANPAQLIELVAKGGEHKAFLTIDQLLILGFMGGCFVGLGGLVAYSVTGDSTFLQNNPGISRFVFGCLFPIALVLILLTGSELYTGNSFTLIPALFNKQISIFNFAKNWICVYVSNMIGALFTAYFFGYWAMVLAIPKPTHTNTHSSSSTIGASILLDGLSAIASSSNSTNEALLRAPAWASAVVHSAEVKASKTMYLQFLQGIGANWCVCLAVFCSLAARDAVGKVIAAILPVSIFVSLGWEHCIANSFVIPLGMMYGANVTVGQYVLNMIFVTLGNTFAGVVLIGTPFWYVHHFREMHHDIVDRARHRAFPFLHRSRVKNVVAPPVIISQDVHDHLHGSEPLPMGDDHHVIELKEHQ